MNIATGTERVDSPLLCRLQRFARAYDVLFNSARQCGNARALNFFCDGLNGLEIAVAGDGEASLNDIHLQPRKLPCHLEFLAGVHGRARALLAVA